MRVMWTNLAAAAAVWMSLAGTAAAQQPTLHDDLLDRLVGRWTLTGTIAGRERTDDVTAEWTLNHQFVAVHEVTRSAMPMDVLNIRPRRTSGGTKPGSTTCATAACTSVATGGPTHPKSKRRNHSPRSARNGSARAACNAGTRHPLNDAPPMMANADPKASASFGLTW